MDYDDIENHIFYFLSPELKYDQKCKRCNDHMQVYKIQHIIKNNKKNTKCIFLGLWFSLISVKILAWNIYSPDDC